MATSARKRSCWRCCPTRYLAEIELPDPAMRWQDQLVALYCSVREVMLKHPTLVPIIATNASTAGPPTVAPRWCVVRCERPEWPTVT